MANSPSKKIAEAKAMVARLEKVNAKAEAAGTPLVAMHWEEFREACVGAFQSGTYLAQLMQNALGDARQIAVLAHKGLVEQSLDDDAEQIIHKNAGNLLEPAGVTDSGMQDFSDYATPSDLRVYRDPNKGVGVYWLFDSDNYFSAPHTGCPARNLAVSDDFPMRHSETASAGDPENFLEQFFRTAVQVALNDPVIVSAPAQ